MSSEHQSKARRSTGRLVGSVNRSCNETVSLPSMPLGLVIRPLRACALAFDNGSKHFAKHHVVCTEYLDGVRRGISRVEIVGAFFASPNRPHGAAIQHLNVISRADRQFDGGEYVGNTQPCNTPNLERSRLFPGAIEIRPA